MLYRYALLHCVPSSIANNSLPLNASLCPLIPIRRTNALMDSADSLLLFDADVGLWVEQGKLLKFKKALNVYVWATV